MKKSALNVMVDALLVIAIFSVAFMGILLGFFVGRGSVPQAEKYLWGLHRHDWGDLHLIFSMALVGLVVLHFFLHVGWVRSTSKRLLGLHWLASLAVLLLIAAGILCGAILLKRAYPGRWGDEERGPGKGGGRGTRLEEGRGAGRDEGRGEGWRGGRQRQR